MGRPASQQPHDPAGQPHDPVVSWVYHELSEGRSVTLKARGRSMYPWVRDGDRVSVRPLSPERVRLGQVVFFWSPQAPADERLSSLHRVLWYTQGWVWTKGDALPRVDSPVARDLLLGEAFQLSHTDRGGEGRTLRRVRAWVCFGGGRLIAVLTSLCAGLVIQALHRWRALRGQRLS